MTSLRLVGAEPISGLAQHAILFVVASILLFSGTATLFVPDPVVWRPSRWIGDLLDCDREGHV